MKVTNALTILLVVALISSICYLLGFVEGYTKNDTKHEFIIGMDADMEQLMDAMQNITIRNSPSNHSCLEGCYYAFEEIASHPDITAIGNFPKYSCDDFCRVMIQ